MARKALSAFIVVLCAMVGAHYYSRDDTATADSTPLGDTAAPSDSAIARAWRDRRDNLQVRGQGTVTRLLADDTDGDRHQRFIVELKSGQTVLIAHNIDLAPRISALQTGDDVEFFGEYEWNERGGLIHWTHRDPAGVHADGWLEHAGRRYE